MVTPTDSFETIHMVPVGIMSKCSLKGLFLASHIPFLTFTATAIVMFMFVTYLQSIHLKHPLNPSVLKDLLNEFCMVLVLTSTVNHSNVYEVNA